MFGPAEPPRKNANRHGHGETAGRTPVPPQAHLDPARHGLQRLRALDLLLVSDEQVLAFFERLAREGLRLAGRPEHAVRRDGAPGAEGQGFGGLFGEEVDGGGDEALYV